MGILPLRAVKRVEATRDGEKSECRLRYTRIPVKVGERDCPLESEGRQEGGALGSVERTSEEEMILGVWLAAECV